MRILALLLLLPSFAFADDIALTSKITAVTIYPQGATLTRRVLFEAPSGAHRLILNDIPTSVDLNSLRLSITGVTLGAISMRQDNVPPQDENEPAALKAAKDEVDRLTEVVATTRDRAAELRLAKTAAQARTGFLARLGEGETLSGMAPDALRELSRMVGEETHAAETAVIKAEAEARAVVLQLREDLKALAKAEQALKALVPEVKERSQIIAEIEAPSAIEGELTLTYQTHAASWQPVYDVHLTRGETAQLDLKRGALVVQYSGENWLGVALQLSSVRPAEQFKPGEVYPWRRRIVSAEEKAYASARKSVNADVMSAMAGSPIVLEEATAASATYDGLAVVYDYDKPVDLASGAEALRISLGQLQTTVEIEARAVPQQDMTAFMMANITNDTGEIILPGQGSYYLDGRFVGRSAMPHVPVGEEAALSFGPIDGIRISRNVPERNEGDRGLISRSNEVSETAQLEIRNLTNEAWNLRVVDRVPYSEQEDLSIAWRAEPAPTEEDVDDKRGVLAWEFELKSGETRNIDLRHTIRWPDGMELR